MCEILKDACILEVPFCGGPILVQRDWRGNHINKLINHLLLPFSTILITYIYKWSNDLGVTKGSWFSIKCEDFLFQWMAWILLIFWGIYKIKLWKHHVEKYHCKWCEQIREFACENPKYTGV